MTPLEAYYDTVITLVMHGIAEKEPSFCESREGLVRGGVNRERVAKGYEVSIVKDNEF